MLITCLGRVLFFPCYEFGFVLSCYFVCLFHYLYILALLFPRTRLEISDFSTLFQFPSLCAVFCCGFFFEFYSVSSSPFMFITFMAVLLLFFMLPLSISASGGMLVSTSIYLPSFFFIINILLN